MKIVYCSELQKSIYDEVTNASCISISVSNIKMTLYKNQRIINSMMWNSFEDNAGICQLTDFLKIC